MFLLSQIKSIPLLKKSLLTCAVAGSLAFGSADGAEAGHGDRTNGSVRISVVTRTTTTTYRLITSYKTRCEPYNCTVIRYDHCGRAYRSTVVKYRTVRVPVTKLVKVCY